MATNYSEVKTSRVSNRVNFKLVSTGYLFNSKGDKVFVKLFAVPCSSYKKLMICRAYDFSLNWNKWSLAKVAFSVRIWGTNRCTYIETKLPMNINEDQDYGDIIQTIVNNVGFKFQSTALMKEGIILI